jgi:RND family efflux transporter MFP subunit
MEITSNGVALGTLRLKSVAVACALACGALLGCAHRDDSREANVSPPPPVVVVQPARAQTVPITQDYQGTTGAIVSVDVRARVQGTLDSAPFKEGTLVHEGQLIFTLQRQPYVANLESADAQLLAARSSLQQAEQTVPVQQALANLAAKQATYVRTNITVTRLRPLAADKAVPQKDLDNAIQSQAAAKADVDGALAQLQNAKVNQQTSIQSAKAQILSSEATVSTAKLNLSYTQIYAPVTGLIGFLKYDVGNVVGGAGNEVLDTITSIDPIKVNFAVDENTYLALSGTRHDPNVRALRDQELRVVLADNSVYAYPGRLYTVNPTLDTKTGTIVVEARFPNPGALLRPGQFARIRLTIEQRPNAVLVPQTAIVQTQGVNTAYVVDANDVVQLRSVTLGPQYESSVIVQDGLKAGERVIVEGTQKVHPGIKVVAKSS